MDTVSSILEGPFGETEAEQELQEKNYRIVVQELLPCVIGETVWRGKRSSEMFHKLAKISDEGFVLVVLENFDETWSDLREDKLEKSVWKKKNKDMGLGKELLGEDQMAARPMYSDGGAGAKNQGWTQDGLERFGDLCLKVQGWRKKSEYKRFAKKIMNQFKVHETSQQLKPAKKKSDTPAFRVYNDLDAMSESSDKDEESDIEDDEQEGGPAGQQNIEDPISEELMAQLTATGGEETRYSGDDLYEDADNITGV